MQPPHPQGHGSGSPAWRRALRIGAGFLAPLALQAATAPTWDPISAEHKSARPPSNSPDAPAEILYERIDLVVKDYKAIQKNFRRIKIYSERATEDLAKLGVDYTESEKVSDLAVRVVHPDGQSIVLPESQFQVTVLGRWNHGRRMTKRLVVPRLAPGDIVEMQWRIDEDGRFKGSRFIYCQQTIPVRRFEFLIRNSHSGAMNLASFNTPGAKLEGLGTDRGKLVITNLPAYVEEADMPPAFNSRASVLLAYGDLPNFDSEIWSLAIDLLQLYESVKCAATPELRQEAAALTAGLKYRDEQLRKIYDFCQEKVANNAYEDSPECRVERVVYHEPRTAAETWKVRRGNPLEINCLFATLAKAAGFEARLSFSADRDEIMNVQFSHGWYFMKSSGVLVKLEGEWKLFAPGDRAVPFGLRRWQREETSTFVLDEEKYYHWVETETSFQERAKRTRQGRLAMDENGGLSGDVSERLDGQFGISWREDHWDDGPLQLEEAVRREVQEQLPEAAITGIHVDHLKETAVPLVLRYTLQLPNFGAVTGDRLVVVPSVFEMHAQPRYAEPTRVHAIRLKHPWQEEDIIDLVLPENFEVEAADAGPPILEPNGILHHQVHIDVDPTGTSLHYHREEEVGRAGRTTFTKESYPALRDFFNKIQLAQTQSIVLRRKTAAGETTAAKPGP